MVEFRVDPETGRFWLMEINGRFWGSLPLAIFAGVDFPPALLDMWQGIPLRTCKARSTVVSARHITGEIQWCKAVLGMRGRGDGNVPRPQLSRALLQWGRVLGGRETWDGASLGDPLPLLYEIGASLWRETRGGFRKLWRRRRMAAGRRAAHAALTGVRGARRVLFVCHGNICRSPYAAARMEERVRGLQLEVRSAGTSARTGHRPPEMFQRLASARGVDLRARGSRVVDAENLAWADLVVIMDDSNRHELGRLDPVVAGRALMLGALDLRGGADVPDPYLLSAEETALVLDKIDRSVDVLAAAMDPRSAQSPAGADTRAP
jgi:protein-tyrosine-phosphatase